MKRLLKPLDYIFILRPTYFFPIWCLFLAGFYVQNNLETASQTFGESNHVVLQNARLLNWVGLSLTLLMGGIFVLYQVMERHVEKPFTFISPDVLSPKAAFFETIVLLVAAFASILFVSVRESVLMLFLAILSGYFYNFEPFRLKDRAIPGLLVTVVSGWLVFALGWQIKSSLNATALKVSTPYVFSVAAMYLFVTVLEVQHSSERRNTFAKAFGVTPTIVLALVFGLIAVTESYVLDDAMIFYPVLFSLPFMLWAGVRQRFEEIHRIIKYPVIMFAISISLKWVLTFHNYFLVYLFFAVYIACRVYNRLRFGLNTSTMLV